MLSISEIVGYEFLKSCALNYYRIMCYESRISQNELLLISKIVKRGALCFENHVLQIYRIVCFQYIEACAVKVEFPKKNSPKALAHRSATGRALS